MCFSILPSESMAEVLHKSQMTIKTSLAALAKQDLIIRKRQGAPVIRTGSM